MGGPLLSRGEAPGTDPDIRRSVGAPVVKQAKKAVADGLQAMRDVRLPMGYVVNDLIEQHGTLSWWHKTVGTQYNLAQRSPAFKAVFDRAQSFLNDVSMHAQEAANLAPDILPKMESIKDIAKQAMSAEDNQALARPVFEGTLVWGRDARGRLGKVEDLKAQAANVSVFDKAQELLAMRAIAPNVLKMWQGLPIEQYEAIIEAKYEREVLKPGVVFTDKELRDTFGLTDGQIKLYRQFRAAVDKSLTDMAATDLLRYGSKDTEPIRAAVEMAPTLEDKAEMMRAYLTEAAEDELGRRGVVVA